LAALSVNLGVSGLASIISIPVARPFPWQHGGRGEALHLRRMGSEASDEELMLRYGKGDAGAFEALYRRHRLPLYGFLLRQVGNKDTAEELFQDLWMRVVNSRGRYEVRAKFTSWVYAIAHNRLMDFYRANGRASFLSHEESESVLEDLPAVEIAADLRLDRKRGMERLFAALTDLPGAQREAFLLQQEGELSIEEIAAATGVSRETAKSRLRYAVAKLRASLGKES
jgi:RNA polymerase sigma-70 factor (ECF subfamily)